MSSSEIRVRYRRDTRCRIHYSERYSDDEYEYRHVILPKPLFKMIPKNFFNDDNTGTLRLLSEEEWRGIGITQSLGWEHYEVHGAYLTFCWSTHMVKHRKMRQRRSLMFYYSVVRRTTIRYMLP